MATTEQLEREAEHTRAQLADTLAELRASLTPGQVMDQVVDYASSGDSGEFYRNLKQQVVQNPLPVALVGAGLAWLMLGRGTGSRSGSHRGETVSDVASDSPDTAAETGHRIEQAARDGIGGAQTRARNAGSAMRETAANAAARLKGAAASTSDSLRGAASGSYGAASSAYGSVAEQTSRAASAVADSAGAAGRSAAARTQEIASVMRDQPLVLAGIGVALGAALGAMLPSTRTEDRLMGEQSDAAKDQAQGLMEQGYEQVKSAVETRRDEAQDKPASHGSAMPEVRPATDEAPLIPAVDDGHAGQVAKSDGASAPQPPFGRTTAL